MKRGWAATLGGVGLVVVACNALIDRDVVQCSDEKPCEARGETFARSICRDSLCVGPTSCATGTTPPLKEDPANTVKTVVRFVNLGRTPVEGARVRVCPSLGSCDPPFLNKVYVTNDAGYIYAEVPYAFAGSFQVREPPPGFKPEDGFVPTILFTRRFLTASEPEEREISPSQSTRLATRKDLDLILSGVGASLQDGGALVFGAVFDCIEQPLPGVRVRSEDVLPTSTVFYGRDDGFPTPDQDKTSASAIFGFINVPPGQFSMNAVLGDAGSEVPWATFTVALEANTLTTVGVRYAPGQ